MHLLHNDVISSDGFVMWLHFVAMHFLFLLSSTSAREFHSFLNAPVMCGICDPC